MSSVIRTSRETIGALPNQTCATSAVCSNWGTWSTVWGLPAAANHGEEAFSASKNNRRRSSTTSDDSLTTWTDYATLSTTSTSASTPACTSITTSQRAVTLSLKRRRSAQTGVAALGDHLPWCWKAGKRLTKNAGDDCRKPRRHRLKFLGTRDTHGDIDDKSDRKHSRESYKDIEDAAGKPRRQVKTQIVRMNFWKRPSITLLKAF